VQRITKIKQNRKAALALLFLLLVISSWLLLELYPPWANIQAFWLRRNFLNWESQDTTGFHIRYQPEDQHLVLLVTEEAERAAAQVGTLLPYQSSVTKPWLIIAPDQRTMQRTFGWGENTGAVGVYMVNTIKVLSPQAWTWLPQELRLESFCQEGPLVHEYTHYVLDLRTRGNLQERHAYSVP
jgi:hypothetical protein